MSFGKGGGGGEVKAPLSSSVSTPAFRLTSTFDPDGSRGSATSITRLGSPTQQAFDERFPRALADMDRIRETVTPGSSLVRQVRLRAVENARRRAVGNLRDNLARRRVLGSSFANDALMRAEHEFAQAEQSALGESFREEFAANLSILDSELSAVFRSLQQEFAELGIAAGSANAFNQLQTEAAKAAARLAAEESAGFGSFLGTVGGFFGDKLLGPSLDALGGSISEEMGFSELFGGNEILETSRLGAAA